MDLWWNCAVGGESGYQAATFTMEQGRLTLESGADAYSVVQFLQRGQLDRLQSFTLTAKGSTSPDGELFGLFWNYPNVTVFDENEVLRLPTDTEGNFDFCLRVDAGSGCATLTCNGEEVCSLPYEKRLGSSLNFVLKNLTLELRELRLIAGGN